MSSPRAIAIASAITPTLACGLALLLGAACGRAPAHRPEAPLDTVDVTAQPDAAATLAADGVAAPRADESGFSGVLPADFPKDVPLPERSSLVDFGPQGITVEVQSARARVEADYLARLRARGFSVTSDGSWQKGARRLALAFSDASGATRITIAIR